MQPQTLQIKISHKIGIWAIIYTRAVGRYFSTIFWSLSITNSWKKKLKAEEEDEDEEKRKTRIEKQRNHWEHFMCHAHKHIHVVYHIRIFTLCKCLSHQQMFFNVFQSAFSYQLCECENYPPFASVDNNCTTSYVRFVSMGGQFQQSFRLFHLRGEKVEKK